MENPLQNKLLLYYMSGLGGALGGEGSTAQAVGGITKQQIQTENFQKLLRTLMLGGAKATMDKEGLSLKAPYGSFADTDFSIPGFKESYSRLGGDTPEATTYNPSASPLDVAGADLAGLTPEMISQALQLKFAGEELERKKLADIAEAGYYGAAAEKIRAQTAVMLTPALPFIGDLTLEQFKALPTSDKEYVVAKERAKTLGDTKFMSKREWEATEPTERERFLEGLLDRPELIDVEKRLAEAKQVPSKLEPTPVNWSTATRELTKRFGKLDPTGMWAVTPELQAAHRKAQELLVNFKDAGVDPLRAVNRAETQSREWKDTIERNYLAKVAEAQRISDKSSRERAIEWIKSEFYRQYKYIPSGGPE